MTGTKSSGSSHDASKAGGRERFVKSKMFKALFSEGMDLVKQTAEYLDGPGRSESTKLERPVALAYATESMRLTTRLMQIASWLLVHRAAGEGEMTLEETRAKENKVSLKNDPPLKPENMTGLPETLRSLAGRTQVLQERIIRLDAAMRENTEYREETKPVIDAQLERIEAAFNISRREPD